uniref:Abnormal cell migration protein 18-like fibronectin type I domain-containing protein n=1 Tax=Panagrellus redivivus TaxID=6233 RepID=A0A7E4ZUS5_PANRE
MMLRSVVIACLCVAAVAHINDAQQSRGRCWSSGNGKPAQFWDEGSRVDRGKFWYECKRGSLEPRGCFSETNERLFLHQTYVTNGYEVECALDNRNSLIFKFVGCSPDGIRKFKVGETWEDDRKMYWFECRADGPYLRIEVGGCLTHDKTRHIKLGERYDFGDYTYECMKKYNGSIQMCSVGCIHNNEHFAVGQQWPDGDFLYYCKLNGGRCQKVCIGCQFRQKRLYNGDRYEKDSTVYQCEVRPDKYGHKPVGCVVRDDKGQTVERVVGCRWYQTTPNSKVEQTCELVDEKTVIKTLGCVFVNKGFDTLFLYPGTYTIWTQQMNKKSLGVACIAGDSPRLETFEVSEIGAKTAGLKYDQPRG